MPKVAGKAITDPIHGTIRLDKCESDIIKADTFTRLARIRHLGLAYQVFPFASFSRLSHSLGACHVSHIASDHLKTITNPGTISDTDITTFRLGALVHDIGHLPFSHILETASAEWVAENGGNACHHETIGARVLESDATIVKALEEVGVAAADVSNVFRRKDRRHQLSNLLSADFDVDRLDYMLRTAHATGLPYGQVDIEYLISQLRYKPDGEQKIYLTRKALRAAEHFLLGRFFEYQQVAYNKTVKGLEVLLQDLVVQLNRDGLIDLTEAGINHLIETGKWQSFDDDFILGLIRDNLAESKDPIVREKAIALVYRKPPRLLVSFESILERKLAGTLVKGLDKLQQAIGEYVESNIDLKDRISIFHTKLDITKIQASGSEGHTLSAGSSQDDKVQQLIYIQANKPSEGEPVETVDLSNDSNSIINVLATRSWLCFRVYGLNIHSTQHRENLKRILLAHFEDVQEGVR